MKSFNRQIDERNYYFGIEQIDTALKSFLENHLFVTQNNELINVPIVYANGELWYQINRQTVLRDRNNQMLAPIIVFKRNSVQKDNDKSRFFTFNNPQNYISFFVKKSKQKFFEKIENENQQQRFEVIKVVVPTYITITYDFTAWVYYMTQANELIETISEMDGDYWGDSKFYRFLVFVDSFSDSVEVSDGSSRNVKLSFSITLKGHIIPKTRLRLINDYKAYIPSKISISEETTYSTIPQNQNEPQTDEEIKLETNYKYDKEKPIEILEKETETIKEKKIREIKTRENIDKKQNDVDLEDYYEKMKEKFLNKKGV